MPLKRKRHRLHITHPPARGIIAMIRQTVAALLILGFTTSYCPAGEAARTAVRMWEQDITIPTYRSGEPEKDPIFYSGRSYQGAKGPVYPYPLLDTAQRREGGPQVPRRVPGESLRAASPSSPSLGARLQRAGPGQRLRLPLSPARHQARPDRHDRRVDLRGHRVGHSPPPPGHDLHARRLPPGGKRRRQQDGLAGRDRAPAPHEMGRRFDALSRPVLPEGHGQAVQSHPAGPFACCTLPTWPYRRMWATR